MPDYSVCDIPCSECRAGSEVEALLAQEGLRVDPHLDYTCGVFRGDRLVATGSCFQNSLRCLAVSRECRGEGLLELLITRLTEVQAVRGNFHLFLYTKPESVRFFASLGFTEIVRVDHSVVFMENRPHGFDSFCRKAAAQRKEGNAAAIVMNANPFTLGHRHLVEYAATRYDAVHLFVLSEDVSFFPAAMRIAMVRKGTEEFSNVTCHETGPYLISSATFPSYFLKDSEDAIRQGARLDTLLFARLSDALGVGVRCVGEEPSSIVTGLYNRVMEQELPKQGVRCEVIPRLAIGGRAVSASDVRQALRDGHMADVRTLVPKSTWDILQMPEMAGVLERLHKADDVRHY